MTRGEVSAYIAGQLQVPVTQVARIINSFEKMLDFITESEVSSVIPDWTAALTFQQDGSDDGRYCLHPDDNGKKRIFQTKVDDNINNEPPTDPDITENSSWVEVSQAAGSAIKEWAPGVFGSGLIIVFHNHSDFGPSLFRLADPVRPFQSNDIEAELITGKWTLIPQGGYLSQDVQIDANGFIYKITAGELGVTNFCDVKINKNEILLSFHPSSSPSNPKSIIINSEGFRFDYVGNGTAGVELIGGMPTDPTPYSAMPKAYVDKDAIQFIIDGGGSTISTGIKGDLEVPFDCTVTGWTILADQSGSIVVDIWMDGYSDFPPTNVSSITGSEKPTLSSSAKNQDLTLTTWATVDLSKGDILRFNVDSVSSVQRVTIILRVERRPVTIFE